MGLCDDLEGWDRGVLKREGVYIYIYNYDCFVWLCGRNLHNIVKLKLKNKKEIKKLKVKKLKIKK